MLLLLHVCYTQGAAVVILEELEHALSRNAHIYAELSGYGLSCDAFHMTSPSIDGAGAKQSMTQAIKNSGIPTSDIAYVNAHATSTPLGDKIESAAIRSVFQEHLSHLTVSSTKGALGHMLGAAGSMEAIITILALHQQICPPSINISELDEDCNHMLINREAQPKSMKAALSNSFGFGGTNASLVFSTFKQ